MIFEL